MVEEQKQSMNLNAVRLCFQAFLPDETGAFTKALPPCISNAVYDSSENEREQRVHSETLHDVATDVKPESHSVAK